MSAINNSQPEFSEQKQETGVSAESNQEPLESDPSRIETVQNPSAAVLEEKAEATPAAPTEQITPRPEKPVEIPVKNVSQQESGVKVGPNQPLTPPVGEDVVFTHEVPKMNVPQITYQPPSVTMKQFIEGGMPAMIELDRQMAELRQHVPLEN